MTFSRMGEGNNDPLLLPPPELPTFSNSLRETDAQYQNYHQYLTPEDGAAMHSTVEVTVKRINSKY